MKMKENKNQLVVVDNEKAISNRPEALDIASLMQHLPTDVQVGILTTAVNNQIKLDHEYRVKLADSDIAKKDIGNSIDAVKSLGPDEKGKITGIAKTGSGSISWEVKKKGWFG
jgi:uncharacterized membrane protein YvbJ